VVDQPPEKALTSLCYGFEALKIGEIVPLPQLAI